MQLASSKSAAVSSVVSTAAGWTPPADGTAPTLSRPWTGEPNGDGPTLLTTLECDAMSDACERHGERVAEHAWLMSRRLTAAAKDASDCAVPSEAAVEDAACAAGCEGACAAACDAVGDASPVV